ncbi:hypothetical protein G7081_01275 [Vagococcus coleopterorum]|uniref:Uncharacterized protein n=1 Tax=Vagococcus coleopterorum TaxID=2714946 RepID=A0A6G8ALK8_9ENTE|nr:hypothetical protein [Vagococcus coleopterorum]QIL45815.1 hypothetical protein G7081_01275 [Vagococcus coleopterorum]
MFSKKKDINEYDYEYEYEEVGTGTDLEKSRYKKAVNSALPGISNVSNIQKNESVSTELKDLQNENARVTLLNEKVKQEVNDKQQEIDLLSKRIFDYQEAQKEIDKTLDTLRKNNSDEVSKLTKKINDFELEIQKLLSVNKELTRKVNENNVERESENNQQDVLLEENEKLKMMLQQQQNKFRQREQEFNERKVQNDKNISKEITLLKEKNIQLQEELRECTVDAQKPMQEVLNGKIEIADALVEAKSVSKQIINGAEVKAENIITNAINEGNIKAEEAEKLLSQAETNAQKIINQATFEANNRVSEAELQLRSIKEQAYDLYKDVMVVKEESAESFNNLTRRLSVFDQADTKIELL